MILFFRFGELHLGEGGIGNKHKMNITMEKWNDRYRIPSARATWWDYSNNGSYFITICTRNMIRYFGEIENSKMKMTAAGAIVQGFWYEIPHHFPFTRLGEFIVMPNHIHGIIIIERMDVETLQYDQHGDEKTLQSDLSGDEKERFRAISPKSGSLPTIIRSYKSICTKTIHEVLPHLEFQWQPRYWDHIIKNEKAFMNISNYIQNNPKNWKQDQFHVPR